MALFGYSETRGENEKGSGKNRSENQTPCFPLMWALGRIVKAVLARLSFSIYTREEKKKGSSFPYVTKRRN